MTRLRSIAALIVALLVTPVVTVDSQQGPDQLRVSGTVTDGATGRSLENVCVAVSVPARCFTATNAGGRYSVDLSVIGASPGSTWGLIFIRSGYVTLKKSMPVNSEVRLDVELTREGPGPAPSATLPPVVQSPPPTDEPPSPSPSSRPRRGACSTTGG